MPRVGSVSGLRASARTITSSGVLESRMSSVTGFTISSLPARGKDYIGYWSWVMGIWLLFFPTPYSLLPN